VNNVDGAVPALPDWVPERLFPFRSRFLELAGCRVHYVDEGSGPALLMLHGNPTWAFLYREIIRALAPYWRCVALDYPGFGLSTAPPDYDFRPASHARIVEAFVKSLDLRAATLMAQDWGGPLGLWVAGRQPERFAGLILGNTWAWPVNGDAHFEWFSRLVGGPLGRFLIHRFNAFVNLLIPLGVRRGKVAREVMEAYRGPFRERSHRTPTAVFPREIIGSRAFLAEVEAGLPKLAHLPTLIVWGDADFAFRRRERERFEQIFSNHRAVTLRGAGHFIQEDAAGEIVEAVQAWREPTKRPAR
jgi:haloalkane dehalogenase